MKQLSFFFAVCSVTMVAFSQGLDTAALRAFDAGVVAKVYALARYTNLTTQQQIYLANYYKRNDSIVRAWILQGQPAARIDSLEEKCKHIFFELNGIDPGRKTTVAGKSAERFANMAAEGEMDFIRQEFRPGREEEKTLRKLVSGKYSYLYQGYLMNDQDTYNAAQALKLFDLYQLYPGLYADKFIGDYLARLSRIKPVPDSIQQKIRAGFLRGIQADKFTDWSKTLLDITRYVMPDTVLFSGLFHAELMREAAARCGEDRYNLIVVEHITNEAFAHIYGLVFQKHYTNCLLEYTYGNTNYYLLDSLIFGVSQHYDSAVKAALIRDGSIHPTNQFALALKYKEVLGLEPAQVDSLVWYAMFLSHEQDSIQMRDPFANVDYGDFEARHLTDQLMDQQYTDLLTIRNKPSAFAQARRDWVDMELYHLTQRFDKEQTIIEIGNYYIARYSSWNRLAYDSKKQTANMRALEETKPQALKLLEQAKWNPEPEKSSNNMKIQW